MEAYSINNIKSFGEKTEINIKPITIFVGKNSCGKSSLIRFPVVLSQSFSADTSSPIKFYGKLIDYGNYEDVVFKNKRGAIEFSVKYRMNLSDYKWGELLRSEVQKTLLKMHEVEVVSELNKVRKRVIVSSNKLYIDGRLCYGLYRDKYNKYNAKIYASYDVVSDVFTQTEYEVLLKSPQTSQFVVETEDCADALVKKYFPDEIEELNKPIAESKNNRIKYRDYITMSPSLRKIFISEDVQDVPFSENFKQILSTVNDFKFYADLLLSVCRKCEYEMLHLSYIGPFRMNPERVYRDEEFETRMVGVKGENVSTVLIRDNQKKKELVGKISSWLNSTMGYKLVVDEVNNGLFRILLEDSNGVKSNLIDVGYGISQILPIIAQILVDMPSDPRYKNSDNLIIMEQPELHLHPAAQSELAELIVNGAIDGKKKMLIETHSEHLIRKLQVLVADSKCELTNEDIAVYYVDKDDEGCAHVNELKILPNGKFAQKWPSGFFDKAHELSMELLRNSAN